MTEDEQRLYDQIVSDVIEVISLRTANVPDGAAAARAAIVAGVALETVAKSITDVIAQKSR